MILTPGCHDVFTNHNSEAKRRIDQHESTKKWDITGKIEGIYQPNNDSQFDQACNATSPEYWQIKRATIHPHANDRQTFQVDESL